MPNLILDLPSEIIDKIFKEFLGFAGYRWSKTNELFTWRKFNERDNKYFRIISSFFKIRYKNVDFTNFQGHWNRIRIYRELSSKPWHYMKIDYLYDCGTDQLIYAFEKRSSKKAPPPANYQFQCLLSDVYEKNDSFKKAYKHATTKSYQ